MFQRYINLIENIRIFFLLLLLLFLSVTKCLHAHARSRARTQAKKITTVNNYRYRSDSIRFHSNICPFTIMNIFYLIHFAPCCGRCCCCYCTSPHTHTCKRTSKLMFLSRNAFFRFRFYFQNRNYFFCCSFLLLFLKIFVVAW